MTSKTYRRGSNGPVNETVTQQISRLERELEQAQLGLSESAEALESLLVNAREFSSDWRKGDFVLGTLAECDMKSMEEQLLKTSKVLTIIKPLIRDKEVANQ